MAKHNGPSAMNMRGQHVGVSLSPHHPQQYGSQVTNISENVLSPHSHASPSPSIDLSTLYPSFSSNITSEFTSAFFDSDSQNSFGRNVGSATLISPSQSQSLPPKPMINGGLVPADEWSGTTIAGPGTPNTQQGQVLQYLQGQGPPGQTANQTKQPQFVYEGRVAANPQVLQATSNNQYQAVMSTSKLSGGFPGGNRDTLQSYSNEVVQCITPKSSQVPIRSPQHAVDITAMKSEYPDMKRVKTEFGMEGVKAEYTQDSLTQEAVLRSSRDSAYQEGSFHGPISSNQLSVFDGDSTNSNHSGLEGDTKVNRSAAHQLVGLMQSGNFQAGEISSPQSAYSNGQACGLQSTQNRGQQGQSRAHTNFLGSQKFTQQNNFQSQQSLQSLRSLGLIQGGNFQGSLQSLGGVPQQSSFAGQSNANHLAHFQRSPSQQSLLQITSSNPLSPYQAQKNTTCAQHVQAHVQAQAQAQPQAHAHAQAQAQAQAQVQVQVQAQAQAQVQAQEMSQAHAQAQAANQQAALQHAVANQAAIIQARHAQGVGSQQQLLLQQQRFQSGQTQAFQPGMQNQLLQGLKLSNPHLIQGSGLKCENMGNGYRSRMPPAIVSECNHTIVSYIQEQRKRPPDNNITFWRGLVHTFFEPGALKRWCLSSFNTSPVGRHAQGLFPMEFWFCNLCGVQPGRGFESCTDVLPRLFKIKYDSGLLDELLFLDLAEEYVLPSGKMVLVYFGAVHESIFAELRVIRYGTLRVTFSPSYKIQAWEFCTKSHEELVPYKNLQEQAQQLDNLVMEAEQEDFNKSVENLTKHCNAFMTTARQLAVKLDAPIVNDLGFSKRYVRCLQISEVVNSMKDLISYEKKSGLGPIQSLVEFPSARKLQQQGLLTNHPNQPSLTTLINHFTQGTPWQSYLQQQGQVNIHFGGQVTIGNGQQGVSHLQGHLLSQLQPGPAQGQRYPNTSKMAQTSNNIQSQLRGQMDARNFGLVQAGQAYNNQMQPPGPLPLPGITQTHFGNLIPCNGLPGQLQTNMVSQGLTQQGQAAHPGCAVGSAQSFPGNQANVQLNHAQELSQLQGHSTISQVPSSGLSGSHTASPVFNQLSHSKSFPTISKQLTSQPTGLVHSQSHNSLNQPMVNGGQQSLPGTPQSEISDLRSNA
ncbi:uncharacterized protein [Physcomitrium patens]|uniref:uncharacterized protein isoform X3 n=1 Tax=Physcomitrium patens TaxID=3218 RepID=UPI000D159BD7|nr:transcriptional corepressor SEUSS-like isoform X3 [Physcomitrium patens]|eukprot:XP_024375456.1 transcriptional corepressor SEUSS-like isoform X3 [Physcomitrella patens]